jgi:hypothetical protein
VVYIVTTGHLESILILNVLLEIHRFSFCVEDSNFVLCDVMYALTYKTERTKVRGVGSVAVRSDKGPSPCPVKLTHLSLILALPSTPFRPASPF